MAAELVAEKGEHWEERFGAIALVDVKVDDEHLLGLPRPCGIHGAHSQIVEQAKSGAKVVVGVMGATSEVADQAVVLRIEGEIDCGDRPGNLLQIGCPMFQSSQEKG